MEFLLLGFSELLRLRVLLFLVFLVIHLVTLAGNMMIFLAVVMEPSRPPMLLFLCQLSAIELFYTLVIVPKALLSLVAAEGSTISFLGCAAQMLLFVALGGAECFLLAAMSYDRYVAICQPLRYAALMSQGLCLRLALACALGASAVALALTVAVFRLPFCQPRRIDHFFCDVPAMLHVACTQSYGRAASAGRLRAPPAAPLPPHPGLLRLHCHRFVTHHLPCGKGQGLLHLHFTPGHHLTALRMCHLHLHPPQVQLLTCSRQGGVSGLHQYYPINVSPHL